ncbi:MAG: CinA family protein [Chloroflexi bacterium]|nr:CinA family protein [Chloroflexota bacterium]
MLARGWTLATAESCTGGLIGHTLTDLPGSSAFYQGGVVAYSYEAKTTLVGVSQELLLAHGAVSHPVAFELARGVRRILGTQVGLSVTGIAGPSGGTPTKPVGTVYVAVSSPCGDETRHFVWDQDRRGNKHLSALAALELIIAQLA